MITVYIDVLFLINFSVDYIVLTLTGKIMHYSVKRWGEILAALILALYSLWALLICGSYFLLIATAFLVVTLVCCFIYKIRTFKSWLRTILLFVALNALFSGIVELLFRVIGQFVGTDTYAEDNRKVLLFAGIALLSGVLLRVGNRLLDAKRGVEHIKAKIKLLSRTYDVDLFVDSGNLVTEPLSGRRVVFITEQYAQKHKLVEYINNNEGFLTLRRIVCIETAGGKRALHAYLCDEIRLEDKTVQAAIAIVDHFTDREYDGIFPAALL